MGRSKSSADNFGVEDFLQHYGTKGMRWGKRKTLSDIKNDRERADRKFEKTTKLASTEQKVFEAGIKSWNTSPAFKAINSKPRYAAKRAGFKYGLTTDRRLYKSYNSDMGRAFAKHLNEHANKAGKNPSGTRTYGVKLEYMSDTRWKVITRPIKHDDGEILVELIRDDKGFITEFKMAEPLTHATDMDNFLEHFGVKGMRWGARTAGTRTTKEPASTEAASATAIRAKAKTGKVKALSNKELQEAINRMNLEQQFKRLSTNERPVVTRFIASTLLEIGKREVQAAIAKKVVKVAAKVAT